MQVKVFEAPDMATGLRKIRRELGPDALILSTRTVKEGKLGLLGKQTLEITAAIDKQWPEESLPSSQTSHNHQASKAYQDAGVHFNKTSKPSFEPDKSLGDENSETTQTKSIGNSSKNQELQYEVDALKDMVKNLAGEISRLGTQQPQKAAASTSPLLKLEHKLRSARNGNVVEDILLARGIDSEAARVISTFAQERLEPADLAEIDKIYTFLHETIADIFTVNSPDFKASTEQKRIALLGPTGVGKTTTLAKIGAKYLAERSNSIAFITIDTYRIAAVEQLKVYGEIMHLPVEVVITPQQLIEALTKHQDKELILIDTAGRSPLDSLSIEEIQTFFTPDLHIENYLVLSATTRDNELLETFSQFQQVPIHSTIFTKVDECSTLGVLLNMQVHHGKPVSYITNGQRVPEDIMEAENKKLAELIIPFPNGIVHE